MLSEKGRKSGPVCLSGTTQTRRFSHMMLWGYLLSLWFFPDSTRKVKGLVSEGRGVGSFGLCSELPLKARACTQSLDNRETEFCPAPSWPYLHCSPLVAPAFSDILTLQEGTRDLCGGGGGPAIIAVPRPSFATLWNWRCFPCRPLKMCIGKVEHLCHLLWWALGFSRRLQCLQGFPTTQGHQVGLKSFTLLTHGLSHSS